MEVIEELVHTEETYIQNLKVIVNLFLKPLEEKNILNKVQLSNLFSNVQFIYDQVNSQLLLRLQSLPPIPTETQKDSQIFQQEANKRLETVGVILHEFAPMMKLYAVYCSNQPMINERIHQFKEDSNFSRFLKKVEKSPSCKKITLEAFLITPMQRLCKYPLLLEELLKCTKEGSESHRLLTNALEEIKDTVKKVNERVGKIENLNSLIRISKDITFASTCPFDLLEDHNRIFLTEGEFLYNHHEEVISYLFSDIILLARGKLGVFEVNQKIWIRSCLSFDLESEENEKSKEFPFSIRIHRSSEPSLLIFSFKSKFKRKFWLKSMNSLIHCEKNVERSVQPKERKKFFGLLSMNSSKEKLKIKIEKNSTVDKKVVDNEKDKDAKKKEELEVVISESRKIIESQINMINGLEEKLRLANEEIDRLRIICVQNNVVV